MNPCAVTPEALITKVVGAFLLWDEVVLVGSCQPRCQPENAMNATVNIVCYKWKELANGEHPLMICISKDGKRKYKSLGVSIHPQFWDFKKNKPKRNCPNKELIETLITEKTKEYSKQIIEFKAESKDFTVTTLVEKVSVTTHRLTVKQLLDNEFERLRKEGRLKYASTYKELRTSLLDFNKHLDIYFSEIDVNWLKRYEAWLRAKGLGDNSIGVRYNKYKIYYINNLILCRYK